MEKLPISGAKELYRFNWRSVYQYSGNTNAFHTFFEDTSAVNEYPIVLIGLWSDIEINEIINPLISTLNKDHCIFFTKESGYRYNQYSFRKIPDNELPLFHTDDAHSTAAIIWERVWNIEEIKAKNLTAKLHIQLSDYMGQR